MRALPFVLALIPNLALADDFELQSDVTAVTLYPQGATLTREVPFTIPEGRHRLMLTDLPRDTPLGTVRVSVTGAVMGSVTARNDFVPPRDPDKSAEIEAAEAEVERLEQVLRDGEAGVQAIRLEHEAAIARVRFLEKLRDGEGLAEMGVGALRDLVGMIGEETLSAMRTAHDAQRRADAAGRELQDVRDELEKARQALAALVPEVEERAMLAVAVSADKPAEGVMTVSYLHGRTGWQPVYDLRLERETGELSIERGAMIRQVTGENWQDVALTLSTVRPSEQTMPSEVWPQLVRIEDPIHILPKASSRLQADESFAGVAAEPEMVVMEEAAAEFDGLAVTYQYPGGVTVASGADALRVGLGRLETKADLRAFAAPLFDPTAFLVAQIENDTGELILPTAEASFYLDGRFIGKRGIGLIPAGGEAELSFGPIDGVRLTRTILEREEGDRGVLTKSNALTEDVRIEVENLTGEAWPLRVIDRVPYSEQEDLEITWTTEPQPTEEDIDGKRGVMAWEFDLPAGETRRIRLGYEMKWPEGKVIR